ncbi:YdcF family protein [Rosistilla oblonga]|uniref:YdcF family protein n=1 Tax=Rosistilla oblonga TaxID=2527990 RepID=UPI003A96BA26
MNDHANETPPCRRCWWVLLVAAGLWLGLPGWGWAQYGWQAVEKTLTAFAMPVGLIWNLAIAGCLFALWSRRDRLARHYFMFLVLIGFVGNGWIAGQLNRWLERPVAKYVRPPVGAFDTVVLLGGSTKLGPAGDPELSWDGQRLLLAAQLYHSGRAQRILVTGGNPVFTELEPSHAAQARALLESIGVPAAAIESLEGSNTREEIALLKSRLDATDGNERWGMITNAGHMPRALRLAQREGLAIEPLPTVFLGQGEGTFGLLGIVPTAHAVHQTTVAAYEILAGMVGQ